MRLIVLALLFPSTQPLFAAVKPNPADYNLSVTVDCSFEKAGFELLDVTVNGQHLELTSGFQATLPLALGTYKARATTARSANAYEINMGYEFLFADGKVRLFNLTGFGNSALCGAGGN